VSDGELYASVSDTRERAAALAVRFTALWQQAGGKKKASKVSAKLHARITSDRKRFKKFRERPLFGLWGAWVPRGVVDDDYSVLQKWYKTYARLAKRLAAETGEALWSDAKPKKLPKQSLDPMLPGAYTLLAVAAAGWFVALSSRRN